MNATASRYLKYYAAAILLGLLIIAAVNYIVDPAHLFSSDDYELNIAGYLLSGQNVANVSDYDERLVQKYYVNDLQEKKDIVVIGSSRSMQIGSEIFSGKSFFNNSVSGAHLEDYLAIFELYHQRNFEPSVLILGLDPWILNENDSRSDYKTLDEEYMSIAERLSLAPPEQDRSSDLKTARLPELISMAYTGQSFRNILSGEISGVYPTEGSIEKTGGILADGSRIYDYSFSNNTADTVEMSAISFACSEQVYSLNDFHSLDTSTLEALMKFVEYSQNQGVEVVFYLPPYHPSAYAILSQSSDYRIIVEAEEVFREFAGQSGITVIGGYDPADSSSDRNDFFDGMHPKRTSISKAFAGIGKEFTIE